MPTTTPDTETPETETPEPVPCVNCSAPTDPDTSRSGPGGEWCESCADDNLGPCDRCCAVVTTDDLAEVGNDVWCTPCVDRYATTCDRCGEGHPRSEMTTVDGRHEWCESCVGDHGVSCDDCGSTVSDYTSHDDGVYCDSCEGDHRHDDDDDDDDDAAGIGGYHSTKRKIRTIVHPDDARGEVTARLIPIAPHARCTGSERCNCGMPRASHRSTPGSRPMFGVEIEIESTRRDHRPATIAAIVAGQLGPLFAGAESDSSLSSGVECITHPATLTVHRANLTRLDLSGTGARAHDTTTCGLHVHASKAAFSATTWGKVSVCLNRRQDRAGWSKIFRRAPGEFRHATESKTLAEAATGVGGKYEVLNVTPDETVELRWPRGTTIGSTILATVEIYHALIRYCERTPIGKATLPDFLTWVCSDPYARSETKAARAYLARRGLIDVTRDRSLRPMTRPTPTPTPTPTPRPDVEDDTTTDRPDLATTLASYGLLPAA